MIHNIDGISQTVQYQGCVIPISWELKMNERIKDLAEQCYHRYSEYNIDLEKFAQLIVQECIAVMDITAKEAKEHHVYIDDDVPTSTHQYKIKQHFGVKE